MLKKALAIKAKVANNVLPKMRSRTVYLEQLDPLIQAEAMMRL
jgi:hypothetical protein